MLHENAIRVAKIRNSMRSLWRAFHSYEALPKSNIVPNQRTFPLPVLSLFSGHVPALKSPTPVSAICPRCHAAFAGVAEAVSTDGSERADLIESIEGYTVPHDHETARRGIEWMREPTVAQWASGRDCVSATLRE